VALSGLRRCTSESGFLSISRLTTCFIRQGRLVGTGLSPDKIVRLVLEIAALRQLKESAVGFKVLKLYLHRKRG
jgi:hypothetical protein